MNAEDRQALRGKHQPHAHSAPRGAFCRHCDSINEWDWCVECRLDYPCDVIKVLDATENLKPNDLKTEPEIRASATSDVLPVNECEHLWLSRANAKYQWTVFTYCPKCGEKL